MASKMDARLLKSTKFPPEFNQKADMEKVNLHVMKKWITKRISEILGNEDDVVIELCFNLIEASRYPDIKSLQIQLTGFLDKDTATFCKELWNLLLSGQSSPQGVPKELLEAKKLELMQERACFHLACSQAPTIDSVATRNPLQTRGTHRNLVVTVPSLTVAEVVIMVEEDRDRRRPDPEVVGLVSCLVVTATFLRPEDAVHQLQDAIAIDRRHPRIHRGLALVAAAGLAAADAQPRRLDADRRLLDRNLSAREAGLLVMLDVATTVATAARLVAVPALALRSGCRQQPSAGVGPGREACQQVVSEGAILLRLAPETERTIAAATGAEIRIATIVGAARLRTDAGIDAVLPRITTTNMDVIVDVVKADAAWPAGPAEANTILLAGGVTALPNLHFHPFVANQLMFWKMTLAPPFSNRPRRQKTQLERRMGDTKSSNAPAAMAEYKKAQSRVRELVERRRAQERKLAQLEDGIALKESAYLESTPAGNIITGFENYMKGASGAAAQRRKTGSTEQNRVFSRSSISYRPNNAQLQPQQQQELVTMTIRATHFTPEVLLSAPRRSAGIPNWTGDLVLYSVSSYSFETHSRSSSIRVLNIKHGSSYRIADQPDASDAVWIGDEDVLYFRPADDIPFTDGHTLTRTLATQRPQLIHQIKGNIFAPKTKKLSNGKTAICLAAMTTPAGHMFYPPAEVKPHSSAKVYSSLFVRHWDAWTTRNSNSLWYGQLSKKNRRWVLDGTGFTNLLAGTGLVSPVPNFGGAGDFDIADDAICFVAKDPTLNQARYTKTDLYYMPIKSFTEKPTGSPQVVKTGKLRGYSTSPTFSVDGKKIAFARMKSEQYESDKSRLLVIPNVGDLGKVQELHETNCGRGGWDCSPNSICWSHDDKELLVTAELHGRVLLWRLPSSPGKMPTVAFHPEGSVVNFRPLGKGSFLFVSTRSLVDSSSYATLDYSTGDVRGVSSISKCGRSLGLSRRQVDEFWYFGSAGYRNQALVVKPSSFDNSKKYPLAFLIHGGPQGAWTDDWSTRWNPAVFAEQGYVVVCPNPTGSTGYGQQHVDNITCNWGGTPYEDLVKCFEFLEKEVSYIDTEHAVALGASYGGYMINWIQGHELGRKFKALVCHDGVFSTQNQWSTEELFFPEHDFGGTLWEKRDNYVKWDPSMHLDQWATPQLIIHNELDYRIPISEGLAMFNVLQARGVPSKLIVFPDENHWVTNPENSLEWHREVLAWINKYSGIAR
ncbi:hypothetical protein CP533_4129 [Ophiocordyceps camponoti-saundersi (nom. inval.)]|nr:hypothetical protein CP533_4129 [Ophiocordyceps camponoti-saundersi (nom. inval.)]